MQKPIINLHPASLEEQFIDEVLSPRQSIETTKGELNLLEHVFLVDATHSIKDVLDIACGTCRYVFGLANRGYKCTEQDYTPERIKIAENRAKHEGISVKLLQGDATQLKYENEFDAVLALYILFLLTNDEDVQKWLSQIHRALRKRRYNDMQYRQPILQGQTLVLPRCNLQRL